MKILILFLFIGFMSSASANEGKLSALNCVKRGFHTNYLTVHLDPFRPDYSNAISAGMHFDGVNVPKMTCIGMISEGESDIRCIGYYFVGSESGIAELKITYEDSTFYAKWGAIDSDFGIGRKTKCTLVYL